MFDTAFAHSFGCNALITNTSVRISTLPGSSPGGRVGDVRSHTAASIVPRGGERYKGLLCSSIGRCCGRRQRDAYLNELDGVRGVVIRLQAQMRVFVGGEQREHCVACAYAHAQPSV